MNTYPLSAEQRLHWRAAQRAGACRGHVVSARIGNTTRPEDVHAHLHSRLAGCETYLLRPETVEGYDLPFQTLAETPVLQIATQSYPDRGQMDHALRDYAHWPQDWGVSAVVASCDGQIWVWLAAPAYCLDLGSLLRLISAVSSGVQVTDDAPAGTEDGEALQYLDYVVWQEERRTALLSERTAPASRPQRASATALPLPCGRVDATSGHVGIRIARARLADIASSEERLRDQVHRCWAEYTQSMFGRREGLHEVVRLPSTLQLGDLPGAFEMPVSADESREAGEAALLLDEHAYLSAMTGAIGFGWHSTTSDEIAVHSTAGAGCDLLLSVLHGPGDAIQLLLSWQNLEWSRVDALDMLQQLARRLGGETITYTLVPDEPVKFRLLEEIARQVRERGDHPALHDAHGVWSYSELWRNAGALAGMLAEQASRDAVVAIWAQTNAEAVLAMVACLRAGCAYLPIDPQTPPERLEWLMRNSGASRLLVPSGAVPPTLDGVEVITIDAQAFTASTCFADRNDDAATAYLIYTSGSTGTPKGVAISRANLDHYLEWAVRTYFDQGACNSAVFSSLSFDMVVTPIFACLATGGCLRLWPTTELEQGLREVFDPGNGIGWVKLTPSHIDLVAALEIETSAVRTFVVGGEALHAHQVAVLERLNPAARIFNEYGPTETTVGCLVKQVSARDHRITIGTPISRCRVLVVDESLAPVLPGDLGELLIAGAGVGIGYWRDEALTEQCFISLPGSAERWYRTGDLVCELPSGEYDFRGRRDGQVKLRGHRIELGEIERVLLQHDRVHGAAVFLQADPLPHLVACVESRAPATLADELSAFAARCLPAYMCPDRIIVRSSFPLNGNGKLDRERLLSDCVARQPGGDFDAAEQKAMAELWAQALAIPLDTLAPDSHYQRLGGDSIRAIRLIAAVFKQFGVRLSIKQLYENPTIRELTALCSAEMISAPPAAHGSHAETAAASASTSAPAVETGAPDVRFPAPENSLGMLWLSEKHAGVHAYHIQNVYHTAIQSFEVERLAAALRQLIERHEALRSSFEMSTAEQPMQRVWASIEPDIRMHDLQGMPRERQQAIVEAELQRDRENPFDIVVPGLWRMHVFLIEGDYQLLAWVHHHAILDGWSNAVLMRELVDCYRMPSQALPSNPARLIDYADEQDRIRRDDSIKAYWRSQLDGAHPLALVGHDRLQPGAQRWERKQSLPEDVAQGIRAVADELGSSVRDVCIGAFQRAVATVAYRSRTFVGLVENNRPLVQGGDSLVGCFLNTIPLLCVQGDRSWREHLANTAAQLRELKHHGRLPLSDIARLGDLGLNQASAFQVMFSYVDFHVYAGQSLPQRQMDKIAIHSYENTSIPLAFTTSSTLGAFEISVHSWLDDEARRSADVLFDIYEACLRELAVHGLEAASPRVPEAALSVSQQANCTQYAYESSSLWQLLQRQLAAGGHRMAIRFGDEMWSYDTLSARTAQLADALRRHGVGEGDRVVLVLDRCLQLPALLYAILAVGASYVPVDPETPQARLDAIVGQTEPRLLVTDRDLVIACDAVPCERLAALLAHPVNTRSILDFHGGGECAYIIFTSGTTGVPKGVVVGDDAIVNRLLWMQRAYPLADGDVVLHKTPYSFDVSVWEFFWPIIAGCGMVVAAPGAHLSPSTLSATIRECGVSVVHFVPSMLSEFLPEWRRHAHPSLRYVICSGEALPVALVEDFFEISPDCRLENLYGPTEAAVDVTAWSCAPGRREVPIGRPIDNIRMHVLSESLQVLPDGCVGELCISGVGLADGYWRQEEITRRAFLDHAGLGTRIYRTGDLARWDLHGYLTYHGRIDHQVKLRGQRIELKDVEFHMSDCLDGRRCVALVADAGTDRAYLAAFVEGASGIDRDGLRVALEGRLPGYMIPRAIHVVASLPVTSNGKLDRAALMLRLRDASDEPQDGPVSEHERMLIGFWQQLLEQPIASVNTDLYARGAHSLLMIRALGMIRERFAIQIEIKPFLECATIREQAMLIEREERTGLLLDTLGMQPASDNDVELVL